MVRRRYGSGLRVRPGAGLQTRQRGVTYLALLLAAAITSAAMAAGMTVWSQTQRRERETQLLWAGGQIRQAIAAYGRAAGDVDNRWPRALEDLLLDPRSAAPRRHLRQIYDDPMTRSTDWGLVRNAQGRIVGVYSRAEGRPLKTGRFAAADSAFEQAQRYADWRFTAVPDNGLLDPPPAHRERAGRVDQSPAAAAQGLPAAASASPALASPERDTPPARPAPAVPAVAPAPTQTPAPGPASAPAAGPTPEPEAAPAAEPEPANEPGGVIQEQPADPQPPAVENSD